MNKSYTALIFNDEKEVDWDRVPSIHIDNFLWEKNGYEPQTSARLVATENALIIKMDSQEKDIRTAVKDQNGNVYEDSCMEFFLQPVPESDDRYYNFEINANGVLLLAVGKEQTGRKILYVDNYTEYFDIHAEINHEYGWKLAYKIPYKFIQQEFPKYTPFNKIRGNFFKCGDKCLKLHYGCWSKVDSDVPAFHKPEFFGMISFCRK